MLSQCLPLKDTPSGKHALSYFDLEALTFNVVTGDSMLIK